ncbi:MFS transporter [Candidatus Binatia bacterium]|nr:MFS transporter [Candidatus Binatia bacterium]
MDSERLSTGQIVSYSLPALGTSLVLLSIAIYLPNYYTDELGLSAGMLSWVLMAGRLWDAVTDPVMGHISDRTRSRWGRRRPYFLLSALPIWIVFYFTWAPIPGLTPLGIFVQLLLCYLVLFTFWTVFWVPYISLGMELTPNYHERTRLFGMRQGFYLLGVALGMLAPEAFAKAAGGPRAGYPTMAIVFGGLACGLIIVAFVRVRERLEDAHAGHYPFVEGLRVTFRNRAFVILMLTYLIALVGGSFIAPLTLYVAKYVIKAREIVPVVMLAYLAGSVVAIPVWVRLSNRFGKNRTWTAGMLLATAVYATSFYYHEGTWLLWIFLAAVIGAANGCTATLGPSLSADVIDSDELETGRRREGAFMGIWSFMDKAAIGIAIFIGMQALDLMGYVPNQDQSEAVIFGIKFLYCLLPAGCHLAAVILFRGFPINAEVHAEIRAQLDARAAARRASSP